MPLVSIIVPVYNAGRFLNDCIESIKNQTFNDYEAIFVDDGSTDNSYSIIEEATALDKRFLLIGQENKGVSAARNKGLEHASGVFCCFIDADDHIAPMYLEELYYAITDHEEVDSSMCGFKKIDLLSHKDCVVIPKKKIESLDENLSGFYAACSSDWQRYLWNRMFKTSIISKNRLRFNETIYYKEDGLFVVQYLCSSNGKVGCVDKVLYYYNRNSSGAMSKTWHSFDEKIITNLEAHRLMIREIEQKGLSHKVLTKAVSQAKAASNWILQMICHSTSFKLSYFFRMEKIMISILGLKDYFSWRFAQLFRTIL